MSKKKKNKKHNVGEETKRIEENLAAKIEADKVYDESGKHIDSDGKTIPSEKDRKANRTKIISFDELKAKHDPKKKRISRAKNFKSTQKHKVKYVLDDSAKKWLTKVVIVAVVFITALIIAIIALNQAEQSRKNVQPVQVNETTISMVGMLPQGKQLIEDLSKFEGFFEIEGISSAKLYDLDITAEEEKILTERNQQIRDGIVHYNEEISSAAKASKEENENAEEQTNKIIPPQIDLKNESKG